MIRILFAATMLCALVSPSQARHRHHRHHHHHHHRVAPVVTWSLFNVGLLAAKVSQIQSSCGSTVTSGFRRGARIAGSGRPSLHASGKAVDMSGNPGCIYAALSGWPGGYSTDYGRMGHVHISYDPVGGHEMGLRFAHGGGRHRHHRYAHTRRHRLHVANPRKGMTPV